MRAVLSGGGELAAFIAPAGRAGVDSVLDDALDGGV